MKTLLYSPFLLTLAGCLSSPVTGKKKLLGIIPMPFTGGSAGVDSDKDLMIDQLAPLVWVGLILVVAGGFMWYLTSGKTGLGKFSMGLGISLIVGASILPQIAGWLGLIAVLAVVALIIYFIYSRIISKREE